MCVCGVVPVHRPLQLVLTFRFCLLFSSAPPLQEPVSTPAIYEEPFADFKVIHLYLNTTFVRFTRLLFSALHPVMGKVHARCDADGHKHLKGSWCSRAVNITTKLLIELYSCTLN